MDEFVFKKEEIDDPPKKAKWLAIARVHMTRGSLSALIAGMKSSWNPAKDVSS